MAADAPPDERKVRWLSAVLAERPPLQPPTPDSVTPTRPVRIPAWMLVEVQEIASALGMRASEVVTIILFSYLRQRGDRA
jgi:hypothetical protein